MNGIKKIKIINTVIYPIFVSFCFISKNAKLPTSTGLIAKAQTIRAEDGNIYIYLTTTDVSTLVHECFHAVEFLMDSIGQRYRFVDKGDESWAYLLDYLTAEGLKFLKEK